MRLGYYNIKEIEKEIDKIDGMRVQECINMLRQDQDAFIVSDIENDQTVGFMFATKEWFDGREVAFIQICYSYRNGGVDNMLDLLREWMINHRLTEMVFMTKRNPLAYQRRYKFNPVYTVMRKEI
jgi:hypothetical protein